MNIQAIINELRNRGGNMLSLDTPEDQDGWDIAADIGIGFTPGLGTLQAGRDFERARRDDDGWGMALSGLGMLPFVGGVTKAAKTLRRNDDLKSLLKQEYDVPLSGELTAPQKANATRIDKAWSTNSDLRNREKMRAEGGTTLTDKPKTPVRRIITPEDLLGKVGVQVQGDRTIAGKMLHRVNGVDLDVPVDLMGGPNYGLVNDYPWASMSSAASGKQGHFRRVAEKTGQAPLGIYSAMSLNDGANFSHHVAEALVRQLKALDLSKKTLKDIDSDIRTVQGMPSFVGLQSPDLIDQLRGIGDFKRSDAGSYRKAVAQALRKPGFQMKGAPHFGDVIRAVTEPDLYDAKNLDSGYSIFMSDPSKDIVRGLDDGMEHIDYDSRVPGETLGGFEISLPVETMFPKLTQQHKQKYRDDQLPYVMGRDKQGYEVFDQEWLDGVMGYLSSRGRQ